MKLGFAQTPYSNYLDMTSEWRHSHNGFGTLWYSTTYFDGYQTFNGNVYYKQYTKTLNYIFLSGGNYTTELILSDVSYIREDASGKFYIYLTNEGNEYAYFDNQQIINSQIGDVFPEYGASCNIQSFETNYIGSLPLKRIYGDENCSSCGSLEGIGNVGPYCGLGIEGNTWLECYTKQNTTIQFGTTDCSLFPIPERINLSTTSHNIAENKLFVYPNPTNGIIKIKLNTREINNYELYNIQGSVLKKGTIQSEEQLIDLSNFSTGVYIIKIGNGNSAIYRKIVKE